MLAKRGEWLLYNPPMITRVTLRNFKLHADTSIDAAPLTVFIGPNNSGKSSISQALLLWRQGASRNANLLCTPPTRHVPADAQPYLFTEDQLIDLGDFEHVVRHGERELALSISGELRGQKTLSAAGGNFEIRVRDNQLVYHRGALTYEARTGRRDFEWEWIRGRLIHGARADEDFHIVLQPQDNLSLLFGGGVRHVVPMTAEETLAAQELSTAAGETPRKLLTSIHPVFSLRGFEEAGYPQAPAAARNLDRMALQDRTTALLSALVYDRSLERRVSNWLEQRVGVRIEIKHLPRNRVTILSLPTGSHAKTLLFSNEGTGASQLAFILVPVGLTPTAETIVLSEPEAHLHPKAQVELTRLLVQLAKEEDRQFFIETHSEHVLHALLNSVATGTIDAKDLALYYFENKDGRAECRRLSVNERGAVEGGLPGFFDQSLGELSEYLDALKSK